VRQLLQKWGIQYHTVKKWVYAYLLQMMPEFSFFKTYQAVILPKICTVHLKVSPRNLLYRPITVISTSANKIPGPDDYLFDKSSADNFKVFDDRFLVHSQMNIVSLGAWLWHATRHVRHLQHIITVSVKCLNSVKLKMLDWRLRRGRRFDSQPFCIYIMTLAKLLTHTHIASINKQSQTPNR